MNGSKRSSAMLAVIGGRRTVVAAIRTDGVGAATPAP